MYGYVILFPFGGIHVAASSANSFEACPKAQVNDSNFQLHLRSCGLHVDDLGKVMDPLVLKKNGKNPETLIGSMGLIYLATFSWFNGLFPGSTGGMCQ